MKLEIVGDVTMELMKDMKDLAVKHEVIVITSQSQTGKSAYIIGEDEVRKYFNVSKERS